MFACNYCQHTFIAKSGLVYHQRNAKFCLQIQGKESTKTCEYCNKEISPRTTHECSVKNRLDEQACVQKSLNEQSQMYEKCLIEQKDLYEIQFEKQDEVHQKRLDEQKNLYEIQLEKQAEIYEKRLDEQKDMYESKLTSLRQEFLENRHQYELKIAELSGKMFGKQECVETLTDITKTVTSKAQSNNSNNTNNTNHNHIHIYTPLDLSEQTINAILDKHLTTDVIGNGQVGLANMLHTELLTDDQGRGKYICTDKNRHHFKYTNDDGHTERDHKATKLTKAIARANVGGRAITTIQSAFETDEDRFNAYMPKAMELKEIAHNNAKFRQQLASLSSVDDEDNPAEDV